MEKAGRHSKPLTKTKLERNWEFRTMAKCRKVLPSGQCTKNAVPGRNLCAMHVRAAEKAASKPKKK
jgi:hypothetical protein